MTVAKKETIQAMCQRLVPDENVATVIDSLNTAWRRAAKGSDTKEPLSLGDFSRDRDDLTVIEERFINQWLQKRAGVAPDTQPTPSVSTDMSAAIQKAVEKDRAKRDQEFAARLASEIQAALDAERQQQALKTKLAINEAVSVEKQRLQKEAEAKLKEDRAQLQQSLSGNSDKQIHSEKEKAAAMTKAGIAEAKAEFMQEFDAKLSTKVLEAKQKLIAQHQAELKRLETEKGVSDLGYEEALKKAKDYAKKWEAVEKANTKELFLRRLSAAFAIVIPLVIVQAIEAALFTQIAYKDAGYEGLWVTIVGGILCFGFQGTGLFLTVNRHKIHRAIRIGMDEYDNPIYKKNDKGEIETETFYNMKTMMVLCVIDFIINCFVFFGHTTMDWEDYGRIARLVCFSMITPLGIYFTSEILLNIIDKKEKLIQ